MRRSLTSLLAVMVLAAASNLWAAKVSILVDLDPNSADQTVIVETVTAGADGLLYVCDRVTGNVIRIDPKDPKLVVVGRIEAREIDGKKVRADSSGLVFSREGILYVSGGRNGKIYRIGKTGGAAEDWAQIELFTRTLPDGKTQQAIPANGLVFDKKGETLYVADTARGAIWKVAVGADGKAGKPTLVAQSPLLEGADGPDFDPQGRLWVAANERNAIVMVTLDGKVEEIAKNDSKGPLEFPTSVVFVGSTAYVSNFDTPRRDNLAADGKTSLDGIGASIVEVAP